MTDLIKGHDLIKGPSWWHVLALPLTCTPRTTLPPAGQLWGSQVWSVMCLRPFFKVYTLPNIVLQSPTRSMKMFQNSVHFKCHWRPFRLAEIDATCTVGPLQKAKSRQCLDELLIQVWRIDLTLCPGVTREQLCTRSGHNMTVSNPIHKPHQLSSPLLT